MTDREIVLIAVACELRQLGENLYSAVNEKDEKAIGKTISDIRSCNLVAHSANSNLFSDDVRKKYLCNNAQN
jgi:hypothetical protein